MPCSRGKEGLNGERCPSIENVPRSEEEEHAWQVIQQCQGQFRTGGMGGVTGLDMGAAIDVMKARGCFNETVLDLVQAAESAIIQEINREE